MSSDVVLTAALRNNLLSLQSTQKSIDATQIRLSTGKKVNSALDNPQSFFASQALKNRADDLGKLLDSIGQSIQVIKAADTGVTALTNLINQAQSLATSAQDQISGNSSSATATGTTTLDGDTLLKNITGLSGTDSIGITVTDKDGTVVVDGAVGQGTVKGGKITTSATWTVNDLINAVNDINTLAGTGGNTPLSEPAISASLDSSGHLKLEAVNGGSLAVQFTNSGTYSNAASSAVASALGFGTIAGVNSNGAANDAGDSVGFTTVASNTMNSSALYVATGTLANRSTLLNDLKASDGTDLFSGAAADTLALKIGGKTSSDLMHYVSSATNTYTAATSTVGSLVDAINNDSTINSLVQASFDETTGKISLQALDASAEAIQFQFGGASGQTLNLGFGATALTTAAEQKAQETVRFAASAGQIASLQNQYNNTLDQIDALVSNGDTGYRGTNLLNGDSLVTTFNENRTSTLVTNGVSFTSAGLGLKQANFNSAASVASTLDQISSALSAVRDFGSSIANDLATIQTRQDFTTSLINTLTEGADKLTLADQNEEGAKLLALQTRQQLGVTALSLASQSQQSVLRLF